MSRGAQRGVRHNVAEAEAHRVQEDVGSWGYGAPSCPAQDPHSALQRVTRAQPYTGRGSVAPRGAEVRSLPQGPRVRWARPPGLTPRGPAHLPSFPTPGNRSLQAEWQKQLAFASEVLWVRSLAGAWLGRLHAGRRDSAMGLGSRREAEGPPPSPRVGGTHSLAAAGLRGSAPWGPWRSPAIPDAAHTSQPGGFPLWVPPAQQAAVAGERPT